MRKRILLGSIAALGMASQALADNGLSYTYVEGGYVRTEIDGLGPQGRDVDGDGIGLRGSLAVTDIVHVFAAFSDQDFDFNVDLQTFEVGAGVNWPLQPGLDVIGTLSYIKQDVDVGPASFDDDGFALGAALRSRVGERFELQGGLKYVNWDDGGDDTSGILAGRYFFTDTFALTGEIEFNDDFTTFMIGGRLNFGR